MFSLRQPHQSNIHRLARFHFLLNVKVMFLFVVLLRLYANVGLASPFFENFFLAMQHVAHTHTHAFTRTDMHRVPFCYVLDCL